jgi:hypothetical protein
LSTVARTVQLINFEFDGNTYKALRRRETDDLPNGVVGTAHWRHLGKGHRNTGYYLVQGDDEKPIEFLNNQWFEIFWHENNWYTAADASIPIENDLGLGWWSTEDQEYVFASASVGIYHIRRTRDISRTFESCYRIRRTFESCTRYSGTFEFYRRDRAFEFCPGTQTRKTSSTRDCTVSHRHPAIRNHGPIGTSTDRCRQLGGSTAATSTERIKWKAGWNATGMVPRGSINK